ncbi:MAG: hypothetical protein NT113_18250, partial [Hyphomicrobiales bacterium]|nr:hypothetical protein [Hyphomicrobiales bacterium]
MGVRAESNSLAITDAAALRQLETSRFGLAQLLAPATAVPLANDTLFALPSMAPIRSALDSAFTRYLADRRMHSPDTRIGVGAGHDVVLFDQALLALPDTRFALAGIVNRMDRAYVAPQTCGEIRLIYRLIRTTAGDKPPRLPMTLNLVLHARQLAASAITETGAALATRLTANDGALATVHAAQIDRIETNVQIGHRPQSTAQDFRTDYLQNVFKLDPSSQQFHPAPMENQIDRDRLLADPSLGREFRDWLLAPDNLRALDRGTLLIPERFL